MSQMSSNTLGEHPALRGQFPLRWGIQVTELSEQERQTVNNTNEATLRSYYLLDERLLYDSGEERDVATPEIARLEQRLNLIVDLLGQVLLQNQNLPPPVTCVLTGAGVEWVSTEAPTLNDCVKLLIYLHHHYPQPLVLFGVVSALESCALGQRISVAWSSLPESVGDGLERLIFRAHRRSVAQAKRSQGRQSDAARFGAKKIRKL